jgi:hypothetical protein
MDDWTYLLQTREETQMRCFVVPDGSSSSVQNGYSQIIAIHAATLSDGQIVYFSGDQHDPGQFANKLFDHARLFDCNTFAVSSCTPAPNISDLFCCGHAFLGDGRLLIAGGTLRFAGFLGSSNAWIYDPASSSFKSAPSMHHGRWYPTLLSLGNGYVLAVSGLNDDANAPDQNRDLEVFNGASWSVEGVMSYGTDTLYPRAHLLPDGRVFFVSSINGQCMAWKLGDATPTPLCSSPFTTGFSAHTSVLLPLLPEEDYAPKILVGNMEQPQLIDLSVSSPGWTNTGSRSVPADGILTSTTPKRLNGTLTLLPTGEVLSAGGEEVGGQETHPVLALETYRPATNSWAVMPSRMTVNRHYHSVALLIPDGRVWFAGSNKRCDWSFHNSADYPGPEPTDLQEHTASGAVDNRELRIEIFEPWYFSRSDRPSITLGHQKVVVGRSFSFTSPQANSISRVALVRAGTSTHAFNGDQRYVGVPFTVTGNTVQCNVPDNENLLPPGPYMVFALAAVVDAQTGATLDIPSVGHWITISNSKFFKELKPEIEVLKADLELHQKISEVGGDPLKNRVDPIELIQQIAATVDNVARVVSGGRSFITPAERPQLPTISPAALAAVPIHLLDKDTLARQQKMEGMMDQAIMQKTDQPATRKMERSDK